MEHEFDIKRMDKKIQLLKKISRGILEETDNFPSISRNCCQILANIKMMELNVSDIQDFY